MDDVLDASALDQVALLGAGKLSSEELVRGYIARIDRLDPHIHAFVSVFRRRALAAARASDNARRRQRGERLPPFAGVPIGIKDLNFVRGTVTRFGSRAALPVVLPFDDLTVAPLRRAGFVMLGKLSTSEWGAMPVTEPDTHPPTRNPWSLGHSAGGSSGGSGAALAARMLPVAQGSDGAGSIRIPSAFCHLVGLKPSRGRLRNAYGKNDRELLYISGPMGHTVDDVAAMLDVMSGPAYSRPHWAPSPPRPFAELARERLPHLRIRFVVRNPLGPTHPEIASAVANVAKQLAELGHEVEEATLPDTSLEEIVPLWKHLIADIPLTLWSKSQPVTRWLVEEGRKLQARDISDLHALLAGRYRRVLDSADLWLTPTVAQPAPPIGAYRDMAPEQAIAAAAQYAGYTAIFNVTGLPAINVPLGLTQDGRPMGLQVSGRMFDEGLVLAAARQLEEMLNWKQRRAPAIA